MIYTYLSWCVQQHATGVVSLWRENKTRGAIRQNIVKVQVDLFNVLQHRVAKNNVSQCLAANLATISQSRALHILIVSKAMSTVFEPFDGLIRESTEKRLYEMNSRT